MHKATGVIHGLISTKNYLFNKLANVNKRIRKIKLPRFILNLWQNIKTKAISLRSVFQHPVAAEHTIKQREEPINNEKIIDIIPEHALYPSTAEEMLEKAKDSSIELSIRQELLRQAMDQGFEGAFQYFPEFMFEIAQNDLFDIDYRKACLKFAIDNGAENAADYKID